MAGGTEKISRRPRPQMIRELSHLEGSLRSNKNIQERDALMRFYAMLSTIVTSKGRPNSYIGDKKMEVLVRQPLESAFLKMFQAILTYPSTRPLTPIIKYTCREILYDLVENLKIQLGLQKEKLSDRESVISYSSLQRLRESRTIIHEDTITRFFHMLELYLPQSMRPKIWDEQTISQEYWLEIVTPIRDAFDTFLKIMRNFPTSLAKQKELVEYTVHTILPSCETGMRFRGIRYHLTVLAPRKTQSARTSRAQETPDSDEYDMKMALGHYSYSLKLPSDDQIGKFHADQYQRIVSSAKARSKPNTAFLQALVKDKADRQEEGQSLFVDYKTLKRIRKESSTQSVDRIASIKLLNTSEDPSLLTPPAPSVSSTETRLVTIAEARERPVISALPYRRKLLRTKTKLSDHRHSSRDSNVTNEIIKSNKRQRAYSRSLTSSRGPSLII